MSVELIGIVTVGVALARPVMASRNPDQQPGAPAGHAAAG